MAEVFVIEHITLDGVMQGPGHPDEDTRDGFKQGGWAAAGMDQQIMTAMGARIQQAGGLRMLLGRRTYEHMLSFWNSQGDPFRDPLNHAQKYVASTTLQEPLPWPNSELLAGSVAEAVTALKQAPGYDLCIMGSGDLIQTLLEYRLVDEFLLFIHPVVLGAGRRLFPPNRPGASLQLLGSFATTTGVICATYRTA
ncbi:MAG: dihydrofolate reductase family protein [Clostridia bacterium]